jgi:Lrp/AsnC family leucine-responsive transcriptional regulator
MPTPRIRPDEAAPACEDSHANRLASLPGVAMATSYVTTKTFSPGTT